MAEVANMSMKIKAEFLKNGNIRLMRQFEFVPKGFICSVGTGYRIVKFADHDKQFITRAYSRCPDRSDEYLIRKPTKALSAWDGRSIKFDWLGRPYYSDNTNAVPGRLYMNGVPW
jgi:hypothetical protein